MSSPGDQPEFIQKYPIEGGDFVAAGSVSINVKNLLKGIGFPSPVIRRVAIVAFEAEMNVVMYGGGGELRLFVSPRRIRLEVADQGPGIADLDLAMQEGWSTATPEMRERGFGAGMGLPNMKRNSDRLKIETGPQRGTTVRAEFDIC